MQSALFIGRFQPFHKGHLKVVQEILKSNERVILAVGSAEKNFLPDNPLTASERHQLIDAALKEAKIPAEKYCIVPIRNVNNYALWVNHINIYVPPYTHLYTGSAIVKACYLGKYAKKDGPDIIQLKRFDRISATKVRQAMTKGKDWEKYLPNATATLLKKWNIPARMKIIKDTMDVTKYNNSY